MLSDGLDHTALRLDLKRLPQPERRNLVRAVRTWAAAASAAAGWRIAAGAGCTFAGVIFAGCAIFMSSRFALAVGLIILAVGTLFNLDCNRRARVWRREHPFNEWRAQQPSISD